MNFKSFIKSKTFRCILWGIGVVALLLAVFKVGEFVGFKKASFSYKWGENYYRNFAGPKRGFPREFRGDDFLKGHGIFGTVIKNTSSTLVVQDEDKTEKVIIIRANTIIKRFRDVIPVSEIKENDHIIIIGSPNDSGQIEAKLIRILPPSSALEQGVSFGHPPR